MLNAIALWWCLCAWCSKSSSSKMWLKLVAHIHFNEMQSISFVSSWNVLQNNQKKIKKKNKKCTKRKIDEVNPLRVERVKKMEGKNYIENKIKTILKLISVTVQFLHFLSLSFNLPYLFIYFCFFILCIVLH